MLSWLKTRYSWLRHGSPLKADETVLLFPQSAARAPKGGWSVPLHIWVVELERGSLLRKLGERAILELLDLGDVVDGDQPLTETFRERIIWFMADREMNKRFTVELDGQSLPTPRSAINGHLKFNTHYNGAAAAGAILPYTLASPHASDAMGQVQLVPTQGLSIISDIDDTIKISHVPDKRRLVKGLFFDDYKAADGMAQWYRQLHSAGGCFHYVSASPWQLYPSLCELMQSDFPFGSLSLRHFYIADQSFAQFFLSSREYKIETITKLLQRFPQRQFALVGDSGEKDPEVYCEIANRFPDQIAAILIRRVPIDSYDGSIGRAQLDARNRERWQILRAQLPDTPFEVFDHPRELESITRQLIDTASDSDHV